jgi:hypothetical protein
LASERFVIALHSPDGGDETGLLICPPEKKAAMLAHRYKEGHSLQSGFEASIAELRRFRAIFRGI